MTHEELVQKAIEAIKAVFQDTRVPTSTTRESLETVIEETRTMIDSLFE